MVSEFLYNYSKEFHSRACEWKGGWVSNGGVDNFSSYCPIICPMGMYLEAGNFALWQSTVQLQITEYSQNTKRIMIDKYTSECQEEAI